MLGRFRKPRLIMDAAASSASAPVEERALAPAPVAEPAPPAIDLDLLARQANMAADASEAGMAIGWLTHDAAQIADQARTIAAASEEVAVSTVEIASRSQNAAATAERARTGIADCAGDIAQAGARMSAIETHAGKIAGCLAAFERAATQIEEMASAIAGISAQTNLLALNATIEAARAGEAGRGFAVVAGEVKALSGQTAKATEEIRTRLDGLRGELAAMRDTVTHTREAVAAGAGAVQRANLRVEAESGAVAEAAAEMRAIADVMGQQQQATGEISSSVERIAAGTAKARSEISSAITRLVGLETTSRALLDVDAADKRPILLARLPADIAAWKRGLASVLVGLSPADLAVARRPGADAAAESGLDSALRGVLGEAERQAKLMVESVKAQDWGVATTAFQGFEGACAEAVRLSGSAASLRAA
ncbi:chemotaxis protein [Methylobacterium sp. C25]|uniref:methyl-accepting chemotaxis protein n=1 Tax=Methylobacterium sp. C25 TaxID=2721622 RepID=UPI001F3A9AF4|nr:methyl-accepting chemotaxis protein [Methylobacterium sp. C25]MCE4225321.1 chemotaxis protein [Methylobacterium sp. C25]